MVQKVLLVALVGGAIAGCLSCGATANHYVYATIPTTNQLQAFREDPNSGVLTELFGSPYSVGDGAHFIVIHPSGNFAYVANPGEGANGENDISLFNIASDGGLTEQFPRTSLGSTAQVPQVLAMDPAGGYLYVMDAGSQGYISVFSIDSSSGALTEVTNSPFPIGEPPLNMQVTPSGSFLYVSIASAPNCLASGGAASGGIAAFSVSAGQLSLVGVTCSDGGSPYGLVISPDGNYVYAANFASNSNSISIFAVQPTGALQVVPGSPISAGYSNPIAMTFDPAGKYLYVANQGSNNITSFSISSTTGLPAALTTSTATNAFTTEASPSFIVTDPNGNYLFVGNQGTSAVAIESFSISSGSLTILTNYGVSSTVSSIAVLK